jgi:hypothetical protein
MAKKKKKVAKKAARKKASGAAAEVEAASCSDQELETTAVVNTGGEGLIRFAEALVTALEARGINIAELINTALARLQGSEPSAPVNDVPNLQPVLESMQAILMENELAAKPYVRFVGRVAQILLNHRRFQTITAGDVFKVFLVEIPAHLKETHRQNPPRGQQLSVATVRVSTGEGRKTFNNRMKRLHLYRLIEPTVTRVSGRNENYVLTEVGQNVFDGWPDLSEIPGLELDGPVKPEEPGSRGARHTG